MSAARPAAFALDPALERDAMGVGRLPLCRVRLMDDRRFPWLVLVPALPGLEELIDLTPADRARLMEEVAAACGALRTTHGPDKLNVAALGNRVRQLHVHVVARFVSDAAWPDPVWGVGRAVPYPPHAAGALMGRLADALAPHGFVEDLG